MVLGQAARIAEFPPTCSLTILVTLAQPFGAPIGDAYPKEEIYVASLNIKILDREQILNNLSGGNQQKVVIAKWFATEPRILILDEPTRGIDVAAKTEVHRMISELADKGVSILLISSELPEILALSDRVLVMPEGRNRAILEGSEASPETIMSAALIADDTGART